MQRFVFFIMAIIILFSSCGKDKFYRCDSEIIGKWKVRDFISLESVAYPKDNDYSPVLEFKYDGTFSLKLDVNSCSGDFAISEKNTVSISEVGCTEACCDSHFSEKVVIMLPGVTSYDFDDNTLRLNVPGWGWINLVRISD